MSYQVSNFFTIEFFVCGVFVLYIVYILRGSILFQMLFVFLTVLLIGSKHLALWFGGFFFFFF